MSTPTQLIDRAMRAYFRRFGTNAPQPANTSCVVEVRNPRAAWVVVLRNVRGELARYRVTPSGLRFVNEGRPDLLGR